MSNFISPQGVQTISVPANESIAVWTQGTCTVSRLVSAVGYPVQPTVLGTVSNGQTVFGPYTTGADIVIDASGGLPVLWEVGVSPVVQQWRLL